VDGGLHSGHTEEQSGGNGMRKCYRTIKKEASAEYEEKKSRFIAEVLPIVSEEEAIAFINGAKSRHKMAGHHVYAYYLAETMQIKRYSDDGEPQGTAGIPVLDVIEKNRMEDVVIVVTRYFGGVLLGAAGLIRAYGKAAALAVEKAGVVERRIADEWSLLVEYPMFQPVRNDLEKNGYGIRGVQYASDVEISVQVPTERGEEFSRRLADLTNGTAIAEIVGQSYLQTDVLR